MKKILYIFLTLSILSVGCSKNEIQPTTLDEGLYGTWRLNYNTIYTNPSFEYDYSIRTFSDNGKWSRTINDFSVSWNGSSYDPFIHNISYEVGDYWVEGKYLIMEDNDGSGETILEYELSGDNLTFFDENFPYGYTFKKQ